MNRDDIIKSAMRKIGVLAEGATPSAEEIRDNATALNALVKYWESQGLHLWKYRTVYVFMRPGVPNYQLGPSGDHATLSYVTTTTAALVPTGTTTFAVSSTLGLNVGDFIGLQQTDLSLFWTTIAAVGSGTVTVAAGATQDLPEAAVIYAYTAKVTRPLRLKEGRVLMYNPSLENRYERPIEFIDRQRYMQLPNKFNTSNVVQAHYSPLLDNGTIYVWPCHNNGQDVFIATAEMSIMDFVSTTDNPDLPQEWIEPLIYNLAVRLAPEYGVTPDQSVLELAAGTLQSVMDFDREDTSISFEPDMSPA